MVDVQGSALCHGSIPCVPLTKHGCIRVKNCETCKRNKSTDTECAVGWERLYKRDIAQWREHRQGVGGRRFESCYPFTLTEVYLSKSITVDGQLKESV